MSQDASPPRGNRGRLAPHEMPPTNLLTDDELLCSDDPEAFGVFYDRHVKALLGYFARRTHDPEEAADLTAETFASALVARRRFKPGGPPATAWLFTIAARRLADYQRRGYVEQKMRRSLAMERRPVSDADAEMIRLLGDDAAQSVLVRAAARAAPARRRARDRRAPVRRAGRRAPHLRGGAAPAHVARPRHPAPRARAMSDYISGLRQDLVEAAARQQQRSRAGRARPPAAPARVVADRRARRRRRARRLRSCSWSSCARSRRRLRPRPQGRRHGASSAASRATPRSPATRS